MDNSNALPAVRAVTTAISTGIVSVFDSVETFETAQRMAKALASSDLVPKQYQNNLANCIILIDVARRMRLPVLQVASGLNVIHGRPSWSTQFIISAINSCGQFSPLRFEWRGTQGQDSWGCRAYANDLANGEVLRGPWVDIAMAKAEKWYDRKDKDGKQTSKWPTMPEQMLVYRAGAFFGRIYAGHILSGMQTAEESADIGPQEVDITPPRGEQSANSPNATAAINADIASASKRRRAARTVDQSGEPVPPPAAASAPPVTAPEARSLAEGAETPAPAPDAPAAPAGPPAGTGMEPAPHRQPDAPDLDNAEFF